MGTGNTDREQGADTEQPGGGTQQSEQNDQTADADSSSAGTRIAVVLIGFLLVSSIAGANISLAADRTVLDSGYVVDTMDEEGTFDSLTEDFREQVADDVSATTGNLNLPPGIEADNLDGNAIARESVSTAYVREEMTENIEGLYAFLRGERAEFAFVMDLQPVKDKLQTSIADRITVDTPTLTGTASENVDAETVAALEKDQESYQEAQRDLSDEQVAALKDDVETQVEEMGYADPIASALIAHQKTVIDGLAGRLTYQEYTDQLASDEQALKNAIAASTLTDIDDQVDLSAEGEDPAESFSGMKTPIQWLSLFSWLLPIISLGLIGVLAAVTRSGEQTAAKTGWACLFAGLLGLLVGFGLRGSLVGLYEDMATAGNEGESNAFVDGFVAAFDGMFEALGTQSVLLTAIGIVVLALVIAHKRGHLEGLRGDSDTDADDPSQQSSVADNSQQTPKTDNSQQSPETDNSQPSGETSTPVNESDR